MRQAEPAKHQIIFRLWALLLGFFPVIMLPPLIMAVVAGERYMIGSFAIPSGITAILALFSFNSLRKIKVLLNAKLGFLLVCGTWIWASFIGAVPFYLAGLNFTDAFFESACTFATTGGTTVGNIEAMPVSLLLWRSLAHWFGGIGIVLISVALMPLLGVGGFQLVKAEAPGPEKEKITPRVAATAKILWLVYCALTFVLFGLYLLGGMNWFDALCHALSTMASGGVSTKNAGLVAFNSSFIEAVATVFMLLAGINFSLYYRLLQGKFSDIKNNTELRAYLVIFAVAAGIITLSLLPVYGSFASALRYAAYQSASMLSTTGAAIADYETWPALARMVLFGLMFIGGCSGSTAGGIKVIRHVILWKQIGNELRKVVYPRGIFSIQLNKRVGRKDVIYGAAAFIFVYMAIITATTLITAASGTDIFSSFSVSLSIMGNIGVGFGVASPFHNYSSFPDHIKWLYSFVMIAGRLEIWTMLILFNPVYWRK
ncbi:MAG: TrkH family potassium uptake protein [Treponema sp.]|jgi:trk system potassium uptake protein TrkH|nr:TrkH family potassium uptake protein [Treponema sp.]